MFSFKATHWMRAHAAAPCSTSGCVMRIAVAGHARLCGHLFSRYLLIGSVQMLALLHSTAVCVVCLMKREASQSFLV